LVVEALEGRQAPAVVTTHLDNGDNLNPVPGSLRAAVVDVIGNSGGTITFNLPAALPIEIAAPGLPAIPFPVAIDGTSQPGYVAGKPLVELRGSLAGLSTGLTLTGGNSSVTGLIINGFYYDGLYLSGAKYTITDNFIGIDVTGTAKLANDRGITIDLAEGCTVARNVIAGNANGQLTVNGTAVGGNVIQGNFIGTDAAGAALVTSFGDGIAVSGPNNTVGGPGALGNVVAGVSATGIKVVGDGTLVENNRVGRDATGSVALVTGGFAIDISGNTNTLRSNVTGGVRIGGDGNKLVGNFVGINAAGTAGLGGSGIDISGAGNLVGGPAPADRNVISGNGGVGLSLHDNLIGGNIVQGNFIGTDAAGTQAVPNGAGVALHAIAKTQIGGFAAGEGNVISGNVGNGLTLDFIDTPAAFANSIHGNIIGLDATGTAKLGNGGDGLFLLTVKNHTISGNVVSGNGGDGIKFGFNASYGGHTLTGNRIGTDKSGAVAIGNKLHGVEIVGVTGVLVTNNTIAGNGQFGVAIFASGPPTGSHTIQLNRIGTDDGGNADRGNGAAGVAIVGSVGNLIGGAGVGNVISGNGGAGVSITDAGAANTVQGNFIGTTADGQGALGNSAAGIELLGKTTAQVIGGTLATGNVISANDGFGMIIGPASSGTIVRGNVIGTNPAGTVGLGNGLSGVSIEGSSGNTLGGGATEHNLIAANGGAGVRITAGAAGNVIRGNRIGTAASGNAALGNTGSGVVFDGAGPHVLGAAGVGNVLSGNGRSGVEVIASDSITIEANVIGLGLDGTTDVGNAFHGVTVTNAEAAVVVNNIISGNGLFGVYLFNNPAAVGAHTIIGNRIGADAAGAVARPNDSGGIVIDKVDGNVIGGTSDALRNVISGNGGAGLLLLGSDSNTISGNRIGTAKDVVGELGNSGHGVVLTDKSSKNLIGGATIDHGNTIAFNATGAAAKAHGVEIQSGTGNTVSHNSIFKNSGRSIDLNQDTITLNDSGGDADAGPNNLQNFPVIVSRPQGPATVGQFTWKLNSTPLKSFTIEFFADTDLDPSGSGEGRDFLGNQVIVNGVAAAQVTTDATGLVTFTNPAFADKAHICATATDEDGNTSEFSMVDTDADGLADAWETDGLGLDVDEDGTPELSLSALGADPLHKDLFVEVDAMSGFAPAQADLDQVINDKTNSKGFAHAPDTLVHNPDQKIGVTLHAKLDDVDISPGPFGVGAVAYWDDFQFVKNDEPSTNGRIGWFGSKADRMDDDWLKIREAKQLVYRYCLFAEEYDGDTSSGVAELSEFGWGTDDFMVTIKAGAWPAVDGRDKAATFMHELGHTLGLRHGGADDVQLKPNYHSLMNYTWQIPNAFQRWNYAAGLPDYSGAWSMDYSRETLILNEAALLETAGIGAGKTAGQVPFGPTTEGNAQLGALAGPVDFNQSGGIDLAVGTADVNFDGQITLLVGQEDWSKLQYYFLESEFKNATPTKGGGADHDDENRYRVPPRVAAVTINNGSSQRSRVTAVRVAFDGVVTLPGDAASAFQLVRQSDGLIVDVSASVTNTVSRTSVDLSFVGAGSEFDSLADGRYTLTVLASKVANFWGGLDGNADGAGGDDHVLACAGAPNPPTNIFRQFGDADGDGDTDASDFGAFRLAFGTASNLAFDGDADGDVDATDFGAFRLRFGTSV